MLLSLAAAAADSLLRALGRPARWIWASALVAGVAIPAAMLLRRTEAAVAGVTLSLEPVRVAAGAPAEVKASLLSRLLEGWHLLLDGVAAVTGRGAEAVLSVGGLESVLVLGWAALSLAGVVLVVGALLRIRRLVERLPVEVVEGCPVTVSQALGPAVVGVARPRIVIPRRLLEAPRELLRMVLTHEREHLEARDTLLLALGLAGVVLLPWSPAAWYQLRRLRLAIELDCDRRVIRSGVSRVRYASLLLDAGSRSTPWSPAMAGLVESPSLLESRMKALCTPLRRLSLPRALGSGVASLLLVLVACEAPTPVVNGDAVELVTTPDGMAADAPGTGGDGPAVFLDGIRIGVADGVGSPGDQDPLVYLDGVRMRLGRHLEGLDPSSIERIEVIKGDEARSRFGPEAANGVIQIFTKEGGAESPQGPREATPVPAPDLPPPPSDGDLSAGPTFTPYTVAPQLRNVSQVQQALDQEYPGALRSAGVGGQVLVHFFIDEAGVVQYTQVAHSSGHAALDAAALRVAGVFRFSPAMNEAEPVPVWIALPITFRARDGEEAAPAGARVLVRGGATAPRTPGTTPLPRSAPPPPSGDVDLSAGPTFTPYTTAPHLRNTAQVQEAMAREHPAMLRDAGIGGRVLVHFFIDETGTVADTRVAQPSGHPALDAAALRLARVFEFTPAEDEGRPVAVWIALPITFQAP
jgi:TonB family protein